MLYILDDVSKFCADTVVVWKTIGNVIKIIQLLIPIALVLSGLIDLGKAVLAGDEKERKEATTALLKRFLYGVLVFFVFAIVKGAVGLVGAGDTLNSKCWECVAKPKSC